MQPEAEISIMASAAGFKQQCPSCEALVPIRDPDLIGRKIDCPKCKYRFVVEDPADGDEKAGPAKSKKGDDKAGKKPQKGAKGKRREDDDDDRPSKSKAGAGGGSNKVLIGALVGGVALVALTITAYFLFFADDATPPAKSGGGGSGGATASAPKPPEEEEKKPVVEEKPAGSSAEMITNLLPPDTEGVCAVKLHNFIRTPVGNAVFAAPGTFLVGGLEKNLGFAPMDVDLFLQGYNFSSDWTMNVIHTSKSLDKNAIIAALKLKPADAKIQDQEYFVADPNPWLDALGRAAFSKLTQTSPAKLNPRQGKLGARFHDDQTLVLADLKPLEAFLNAKGNFEYRKPAKTEDKKEEKDEKEATPPAGRSGVDPRIPTSGMKPGMSLGLSTGGASQGGENPSQKSEEKPKAEEAKEAIAFMTIQPALKAMLDRLDAKQPILMLALDSEAAKGKIAPLSADPIGFDVVIKDAQTIGAAIIWKDHLTFLVEGEYGSEDGARRRLNDVEKKSGKGLTAKLGRLLGVTVEFLNEADEADPFGSDATGGQSGFGSGVPPRSGPGGMMTPSIPGGLGAGRGGRPRSGAGGGAGSGTGAPGVLNDTGGGDRRGAPGGFGAPGLGGDPNAAPAPPKEPAKATAKVAIQGRTVVAMTVEVIDEGPISTLLGRIVRPAIIQEKGSLDMAGNRNHVHELANASQRMSEAMQRQFPRAAFDRPVPPARAGRPFTPSQRVSWMAELLPYLGHGNLYNQLDRAQSWRDPANMATASTLIPQFLSPNTDTASWWVKYPEVADPVAATHFVGIAGVGMDAASYGANDPAVADKIGIFGYDRQTSVRDISDGAANTILIAQVPPFVKRPWLAGGGSTAVGVPEKNSVKPFVSTQGDGKKGTLVVMADGSVRFISENVSDEVFKALATIKGNESVILNREAPKVEAPADEVAQAPPAPSAPVAADLTDPSKAASPPKEVSSPKGAAKEFVSTLGKFKVTFPAGTHFDQKVSKDTPVGKVDYMLTGVQAGPAGNYVVLYSDFPPAVPLDNKAVLDGVREAAMANPGSKLADEKQVEVDGREAHQMIIEVPGQGFVRNTVFFLDHRQFQVMVKGSKEIVEGKEADAFMNSFKFMK
jgi:Protein of unknown function (DUF1559)